ncbi:MAG: hypothetical protein LBT27_02310 [Prevotellaceae bacterium]|jgi:hypothetical protein|nr:hypothetical protein [Prevotellaceae bacterium]
MKHILKLFAGTIVIAVICTFTACENDAIDHMSGKYPVPEDYALSNLLLQNVQKNESSRTVTLIVSTSGLTAPNAGTGSYLTIEFLSPRLNHFLRDGSYTIANQSTARVGNYVEGYNGGGTYWVDVANGAESKKLKVTDGTLSVGKNDDNYTIRGTVLLEDNSMVKINYTGTIVFEPDPPSLTYKLKVTKPYAWTTDGTTYTPITGSQLNTITVLSEGIELAVLDVITEENPTTLAGTYQVKAVTALERAVAQGVYMDIAGWFGVPGIPVTEAPSYYLDNEIKMFIREGAITITDNNGTLGITGSNLGNQDPSTQFAFGVFATRGSFDYQEVTPQPVYRITKTKPATYPDATYAPVPIPGSQLNAVTVLINGNAVAYFEFITVEDAVSLAGAYPVKDGPNEIGQMNNGYYVDLGFFVLDGGSYYISGSDKFYIREGSTVTVTDASGKLGFTGDNLVIWDAAGAPVAESGSFSYTGLEPE